jgi:hypothetical protein
MTWGPLPAYPVFGVFGPGGVAQPVHGLDAPLAAGDPREVGGAGTVRIEAGDGVHDFLADQGAVEVVAIAADPRDPGDMREVQAAGVGDPDGAADDPAVAVVQFRVWSGSRGPSCWMASKTALCRDGWLPLTNRK